MTVTASAAAPRRYTVAEALAIVFGTPPFSAEYTTDHIRKVLGKLLGQALSEEQVLDALRAATYATPRPGTGKHLLKWRFRRADLPDTAPSAPKPRAKRRYNPANEKPIAATMKLKPGLA